MGSNKDLQKTALQWRRTKIIATLGPSSNTSQTIEKLLEKGVNAVRLNMSHGSHESHRQLVETVRNVCKKRDYHVAIIVDLCGPKIRVGKFQDGAMELIAGKSVTITSRVVIGGQGVICSQYPHLHKDVAKGQRILLDDGKMELRVQTIRDSDVQCKVIYGGLLKDHKGMNLPDSIVSAPALTDKDKQDVILAVDLGVDYLALSFVRSEKDIDRLKRFLKKRNADIPIISKIERPEAVENIEKIINNSYAIMVARGDLGIELPAERVPLIQRDLIQRARSHCVPVIVATQMLESMIGNSRPTRAEVGDVANAAQLGADAVMLSAETASGNYPIQAVEVMDKVLREIERSQWQSGYFVGDMIVDKRKEKHSIRLAIANAIVELAKDLQLHAIIIPTVTGTTTRIVAASRAIAPALGVAANRNVCRRMALHWGVLPIYVEESETHDWRHLCSVISKQCNLTKKGRKVLIAAGFSNISEQSEPVLKLLHL